VTKRLGVLAVLAGVFAAGVAMSARGDGERAAAYRFVPFARNLSDPVHVSAPRNEPNNLYVTEQGGRVRVIVRGRLRARPFLDISRLVTAGGEQGLLSTAFHPGYAKNKRFYVQYTDKGQDTRVVEYRSRGLARAPVRVRQIFFQDDPYSNHNGGQLAFGPDGFLYAGTGDGGSGGDPENRAQNPRSLFGKLLRFNTRARRTPAVIAGLGLRNPWRFSFDRQTGDLYIGDVGQNAWEEVDFTPRKSPGLENYGWRIYEGKTRSTSESPRAGRLVFPVVLQPNPPNCSVIGGFVYRGSAVPDAKGRYFFGDNCVARIRTLAAPGGTQVREEGFSVDGLSSFGEDARGELYATTIGGSLYKLRG
jgi:glucose/arabinose dehydrogenase